MDPRLRQRLDDFVAGLKLGKGNLSVSLVVTKHAHEKGLPLDSEMLVTEARTQVKGAGMAPVQRILERHGITTILAKEGGRTSRGSVPYMRRFVQFLNELHQDGLADLDAIEGFWICHIRDVLGAKPLQLILDPKISLRTAIQDLFAQAAERQQGAVGRTVTGAVLQHLVGAKLSCALGRDSVAHHGYSTADVQTAREGDFEIGDAVIHVTTAPSSRVMVQCQKNLDQGRHPILITVAERTAAASTLAGDVGIADRIEILDIEQFVVLNLYEWRRFETADRRETASRLISEYNRIVDEVETDPSLRIVLG